MAKSDSTTPTTAEQAQSAAPRAGLYRVKGTDTVTYPNGDSKDPDKRTFSQGETVQLDDAHAAAWTKAGLVEPA